MSSCNLICAGSLFRHFKAGDAQYLLSVLHSFPATLQGETGKMRHFYSGGLILPNSGIDMLGGKTEILLVENHMGSGKLQLPVVVRKLSVVWG